MVVAFDLRELLGYMHPVMIRDLDIAALDHDVHVTSLVRTVVRSGNPGRLARGEARVQASTGSVRLRLLSPPAVDGIAPPTPDMETLTPVRLTSHPKSQERPGILPSPYTYG
ncbi:hypothetical protein GCM10010429_43260 [Micromonospora olivasterospora]